MSSSRLSRASNRASSASYFTVHSRTDSRSVRSTVDASDESLVIAASCSARTLASSDWNTRDCSDSDSDLSRAMRVAFSAAAASVQSSLRRRSSIVHASDWAFAMSAAFSLASSDAALQLASKFASSSSSLDSHSRRARASSATCSLLSFSFRSPSCFHRSAASRATSSSCRLRHSSTVAAAAVSRSTRWSHSAFSAFSAAVDIASSWFSTRCANSAACRAFDSSRSEACFDTISAIEAAASSSSFFTRDS
mmetsp:Transcript_12068/g.51986  ORF Transcript_12068/g.51986 Transcript_12068/m.51986 type:complete len:251 (-) Transcript_12068:2612-3364(-)